MTKYPDFLFVALVLTISILGAVIVRAAGDPNGSGEVDADDIVYLIAYIFQGGPAPVPTFDGVVQHIQAQPRCSGYTVSHDSVFRVTEYQRKEFLLVFQNDSLCFITENITGVSDTAYLGALVPVDSGQ